MSKLKHFRLGALLIAALSFFVAMPASADSWLFFLWMVGSDLESEGGAATADLKEITEAQENMGDDIKFLVQTGGSKKWHVGDLIPASKSMRLLFSSKGVEPVQTFNAVDMGKPEALADFLKFGLENYEADHYVMIFWNHGGGPLSGVGFDELHPKNNPWGSSFLSLDEIVQAFGKAGAPVFDIIGFDTCLQGSIESLHFASMIGNYMVASEETEPGNGWYYTGFLNGLAKNTSMSPEELGRLIVDSYHEGCQQAGTDAETTLALIDVHETHYAPFALAMQDLGRNISDRMQNARGSERRQLFARIDRVGKSVTRYGTSGEGSEVIDAGEFLDGLCSDSYFQSMCGNVLQAYSDLVLYSRTGDSMEGTGLTMYYPLTKKNENFRLVAQHGAFPSLFYAVEGMMTGGLDNNWLNWIVQYTNDWNRYFKDILDYDNNYMSGGDGLDFILSGNDLGGASGSQAQPSGGAEAAGQAGAGQGSTLAGNQPQESGAESPQSPQSPQAGSGEGSETAANQGSPSPAAAHPYQAPGEQGLASVSESLMAQASSLQSLNADIGKVEGISKLGQLPVKLKDDGTSYIEIPKEYLSSVSRVTYVMGAYVEEDKKAETPAFIMVIGEGGQLTADWDKGVFSDQFGGAWPMINGSMLMLEVTNITDRFITYDSQVKVNKKDASMNIVYDKKSKTYKIIGYTPIDESGIQQRSAKFKKGDEITTVLHAVSLEDESREWDTEMDTFKYSDDLKIEEEDMGADARLLMYYQVSDFKGDEATSSMVTYALKDESMDVQLFDDWLAEKYGASGADGESGNSAESGEGASEGEATEGAKS